MFRKFFESLNGKNVDERLQDAASQLRNRVEEQALRVGNFSQYEHTNTNVNPRLLRSTPSPEDRAAEKLPVYQKCSLCGRIVLVDPELAERTEAKFCDFCGKHSLLPLSKSQRNLPIDLSFTPRQSQTKSRRSIEAVIRRADQLKMGTIESKNAESEEAAPTLPAAAETRAMLQTTVEAPAPSDASNVQPPPVVSLMVNIQLDKADAVSKRIELRQPFDNQVVNMQLLVQRSPVDENRSSPDQRSHSPAHFSPSNRTVHRSNNFTQTERISLQTGVRPPSVVFRDEALERARYDGSVSDPTANAAPCKSCLAPVGSKRLETICRNIEIRQKGFTEKLAEYVTAVVEMFEIALLAHYRIRATPTFPAVTNNAPEATSVTRPSTPDDSDASSSAAQQQRIQITPSSCSSNNYESKMHIAIELIDTEQSKSVVNFNLSLPVLRDALEQRPEVRSLFSMHVNEAELRANVGTAAEADLITQSLHALLVLPADKETAMQSGR